MEDEAKLESFTCPLPGYEAGRRVPVNVTIPGGAHEYKSTLLSPPLPELRSTTSDVPLRKPRWNSPERRGKTAPDRVMPFSPTGRKLSGKMALGNLPSPMTSPTSPTTSDFGVIGDGRSQALSQQQNRHLMQTQATPKRQSSSLKSAFLDKNFHPNLQVSSTSQAAYTPAEGESSISQCKDSGIVTSSTPEAISPIRRSQSYCNSNPWASNEPDSAHMRRVSKPVVPLISSFVKPHPEETSQDLVTRQNPPPTRILDSSIPPIWRRGGPPFTVIRENWGQKAKSPDDMLLGSRFDPESFTLPYGVRSNPAGLYAFLLMACLVQSKIFVMKPRQDDDVRASIKNGIWCSSKNGNKKLEQAWNVRKTGEMILLLFSVTERYEVLLKLIFSR